MRRVHDLVGWVWAWLLTGWVRLDPTRRVFAVRLDHPGGHHTYHHLRATWSAAQHAARIEAYQRGDWAPLVLSTTPLTPGVYHLHRRVRGCTAGECPRGEQVATRVRAPGPVPESRRDAIRRDAAEWVDASVARGVRDLRRGRWFSGRGRRGRPRGG